jgi:hypothetical protein
VRQAEGNKNLGVRNPFGVRPRAEVPSRRGKEVHWVKPTMEVPRRVGTLIGQFVRE